MTLCTSCAAPPRRGPAAGEPETRVFVPARPPPPPEMPAPRAELRGPFEDLEIGEEGGPAALETTEREPLEWEGVRELFPELASLEEEALRLSRYHRAGVLETEGRYQEALQVLGNLGEDAPPGVWLLLARNLEGAGRKNDAVWAYARAERVADEITAEEIRARIRFLIDRMDLEALRGLAAACPFCPEGGYARLKLARRTLAVGMVDEARALLEGLAVDFAGYDLGATARALAERVAARGLSRPATYGILLPLTGPLAPFGTRALRGVVLGSGLFSAHEDPGVRFLVADSRGEPAGAAAGVEELARAGVVGIIGPLKGSAAAEAAWTAREWGVPLLAMTPSREVKGEGAFRLYLREEDEVTRLVEYAMEERELRRFSILFPSTPLGYRYRDLFWDEVVARGGEITGVEAFSGEPRRVGEAIQRLTGVYNLSSGEVRERFLREERSRLRRERDLLVALGIAEEPEGGAELELEIDEERLAQYEPPPIVDFDAVFLPVSSLDAAQIAPQFPYNDVEGVVLLGTRSWNYPTFVEVGEEYVEGAIFPAEMHPDLASDRTYAERYREAYGVLPGVLETYAYDAVRVVAGGPDAILEDRDGLRQRLGTLWAVDAVTGPLTTHPDGDIAASPKILTVRHGRIVPAP